MHDDILLLLSHLGAIDSERAVPVPTLQNFESLRNVRVEEALRELEQMGYLHRVGERVFLSQAGLLRALSRYS